MDEDSVYYKFYLDRDGYITIVCLQDFDEADYDQSKFVTYKDGTQYQFFNEEIAIGCLNRDFSYEFIDPEYRVPENNDPWEHMRRVP